MSSEQVTFGASSLVYVRLDNGVLLAHHPLWATGPYPYPKLDADPDDCDQEPERHTA